ncbi:hypothetical protein BT63DRAFT_421689 [Microthyrium microscopicum]|uniref:Uncharacterized protein n=1 Tax=Microthyrium microscopicum TaxID=703497 RepID=A0A6A6UQ44_9PEZI|nr:hypothetical protein BT63DRAFT_421689 [Microthyrium microscopicum]
MQHQALSEEDSQSRKSYYAMLHESIDSEAAAGNDNTLDVTIGSGIYATLARCAISNDSPAAFDFEMRSLAYTTYQAAKNYDWKNPKQERLVFLLLQAKNIGTLNRKYTDNAGNVFSEAAQTSNGARIFADMPFFVEDFLHMWVRDLSSLSPEQRRDLAAFMAKLVSVGFSDKLAVVGLWLFRRVFESPVHELDGPALHWMEAVSAWYMYAGHKLMSLCGSDFSDMPEEFAVPGELAQAAGIEGTGFSVARWKFWQERVKEICRTLPLGIENEVALPPQSLYGLAELEPLFFGTH